MSVGSEFTLTRLRYAVAALLVGSALTLRQLLCALSAAVMPHIMRAYRQQRYEITPSPQACSVLSIPVGARTSFRSYMARVDQGLKSDFL